MRTGVRARDAVPTLCDGNAARRGAAMAVADGNPRDAGSDIIFQQFYLASTSQV